MRTLDRRLRHLEERSGTSGSDRLHVAIVRPGSSVEAERAKLVADGYQDGDQVIFVRFVRPGDAINAPSSVEPR